MGPLIKNITYQFDISHAKNFIYACVQSKKFSCINIFSF